MRNHLILAGVLLTAAFTAGCVAQDASPERQAAGAIAVSLAMATEVDVAKVYNGSSDYDFDQGRLELIFTNQSPAPLSFPGEAIMYRVLRTYTDQQRGTRQVFNINEPPLNTFKVTQLMPGESWRFGIGFELPDQLLPQQGGDVTVQVCVSWVVSELDTVLFPPGSYDWAEDFNTCQDVLIRQ
jgi:hypothetical protein